MKEEFAFDQRIDSLDLDLFAAIHSQTTEADKGVLLAIQRVIRNFFGSYAYLEIGSHLGGSIQPHLLDPLCTRIYSIDNRPDTQPDERGIAQRYGDNSTERMLELLRLLAPDRIRRIICVEDSAQNVPVGLIEDRPQLCFIDGEHTDRAVIRDFEFCLSVADPDGLIALHDADLIYKGITSILAGLREREVSFTGMKLSGSVFVISMGSCPLAADPDIQQFVQNARYYFLKSHLRLIYRRWRNRRSAFNA